MMDPAPIASLLGWPVYPYGIAMGIAIMLGLAVFTLNGQKRGMPRDSGVSFGLLAVPLGLLGARLLYVLVRWSYFEQEIGLGHLWRAWEGGYALFGALTGGVLAAVLYARVAHRESGVVMDCAAPGAALTIAIARFAECFTLQGTGAQVETEGLQFFPFAVQNGYGEWVLPVFLWEGIAAVGIAIYLQRRFTRAADSSGDGMLRFLLLLGATQVFLESLRTDDFLRFGFVKVSQVLGMVAVWIVAVIWGIRADRNGSDVRRTRLIYFLLVISVAVCIAIEFALDKSSIPNMLLYGIMAFTLISMTVLTCRLSRVEGETQTITA